MEKDAAGSPQGHTNPGISRYLASRLPYACTVRRGEGPKPIGPSYPYLAGMNPTLVPGPFKEPSSCHRPADVADLLFEAEPRYNECSKR